MQLTLLRVLSRRHLLVGTEHGRLLVMTHVQTGPADLAIPASELEGMRTARRIPDRDVGPGLVVTRSRTEVAPIVATTEPTIESETELERYPVALRRIAGPTVRDAVTGQVGPSGWMAVVGFDERTREWLIVGDD